MCMHCGLREHDLTTCSDITAEQLGEILIQIKDLEVDGAMMFQHDDLKAPNNNALVGGLMRNRLYLDSCMTNHQLVSGSYLTQVHTSSTPL